MIPGTWQGPTAFKFWNFRPLVMEYVTESAGGRPNL